MASSRVFAAYVATESPTDDDVESAAEALRPLLRQEMRKRGVLERSPGAWGYAGESWHDAETLNDLLHDCFVFVFTGNRKRWLAAHADNEDQTNAAVRRSVRNFLNELEQKKDPVGYRVYKNVQAAVAQAAAAHSLVVVQGDDNAVGSRTVVAARPAAPLGTVAALENAVNNWPDLAALGMNLSRHGPRGLQAAATAVARLASNYAPAWQIGELADALKKVLPPHASRSLNDSANPVPDSAAPPDRPVEESDTLEVRARQMRAAIACLPAQRKVRERLESHFAWMLDFFKANGRFPKQTEAADYFGEDRKRVSEDYHRLQPLVAKIWQLEPDS
jgi:hypothetical protein